MKREFLYLLGLGAFAFVLSIAWAVIRTPGPVEHGPVEQSDAERRDAWSNEAAADTFAVLVHEHPSIDRLTVEGRYMDLYLNERLSREVCREMAAIVAQRFSQYRRQQTGVSGVTVRVIFDGLTMAEADARDTQITGIR